MNCGEKRRTLIKLLVKLAGLRFKVRTMLGMVTVVISTVAVTVRPMDFLSTIT